MENLLTVFYQEVLVKGIIVSLIGGAILAYSNENLNVLRTSFLIKSAKRKLKSGKPKSIKRGVHILLEIAIDKPYRRQEMVDVLVEDCFRRYFGKKETNNQPTSPQMIDVFVDAIHSLLNLPRKDENGHFLNIDLHQIRLISGNEHIYLEKMNFEEVVLWGCDFEKINFSRSNLSKVDLGGVFFKDCGLEYINMDDAKICFSPADSRPTIIENSWLTGSSIENTFVLESTNPQLVIRSSLNEQVKEKLLSKSKGVLLQ